MICLHTRDPLLLHNSLVKHDVLNHQHLQDTALVMEIQRYYVLHLVILLLKETENQATQLNLWQPILIVVSSEVFLLKYNFVSDQPYRSAMYTLIGFVIVLLILLIVCVILLKRRAKERERDLFWQPHNGSNEEITEEPNKEEISLTPPPQHSWRYNITANKL